MLLQQHSILNYNGVTPHNPTNSYYAIATTSNWNDNTKWSLASGTGTACAAGDYPAVDNLCNAVNIGNGASGNREVTLNVSPTYLISALNIGGVNYNCGLNVGTYTLNSDSNVVISAPTASSRTNYLNIGTGTYKTTGNVTITASASNPTRISQVRFTGNGKLYCNNLTFSSGSAGTGKIISDAAGSGIVILTGALTLGTGGGTDGDVSFNYSGGNQTVIISSSFPYYNLLLSGSGTKTLNASISTSNLLNRLTIENCKMAANFNSSVNYLTYGGNAKAAGTYGSTSSAATTKDDTYFSGTGVVTVTTGG